MPPARRETTISVTTIRREEINADKADLHVTIKGSSLVTGSAALKKAKEVSQLVTALLAVGVKEEDLTLQDIQVESSNGVLTRTSSASYTLRIHCSNLELLGDILGAIGAQKNVTLDDLTWRYPDDKQMQMQWLESCIAEAREKAARIAAALGVKLLAVRGFTEVWKDSEPTRVVIEGLAETRQAFKSMTRARVDLGFSLSHSKTVEQRVDLTYAIDRGEPAA
jgi:uncharacterized protein YggE